MKKFILYFNCFALCLIMALSFAACNIEKGGKNGATATPVPTPFEPKTAQELFEKAEDTMESLQSYEAKSTVNMATNSYGVKISATLTGIDIKYLEKGNEFSYSSYEAETISKHQDADITQTQKEVKAYSKGKMYLLNKKEGVDQKFCSSMSYETFADLNKETRDYSIVGFFKNENVFSCSNNTFNKNDDGTWQIQLSGYDDNAIKSFMEDYDDAWEKTTIKDIKTTLNINSSFCLTKMLFEVVFDENAQNEPKLQITVDFLNYNSVTPDYSLIDTTQFKEINSLEILEKVNNNYYKFAKLKSGNVVIEKVDTVLFGTETRSYSSKRTLAFDEVDGGLTYKIIVEEAGYGTTVFTYKDGERTVETNGEKTTGSESEDFAWSTVQTILNYDEFDRNSVVNIEKVSENVYKFTFGGSVIEDLKDYYESDYVTVRSITKTMIVAMDGNNIKKTECETKMDGYDETQHISCITKTTTIYTNIP